MAKRKGNGKRGRSGRGDDASGRSRGRGRGSRGGGRGGIPSSGSYHLMDETLDVNIQMYADAQLTPPYGGGRGEGHARQPSAPNSEPPHTPTRGSTPNRGRGRGFRGGRGRGRGQPEMTFRNRYSSDIGIGVSPNFRGGRGGRGGGPPQKSRLDAPLTRLLYEDRPLLRPIVFVPSTLNPVLFDQEDEDLLKPGVEEVGDTEQSHLPTAAAVSRVFSGRNIQRVESGSEAENNNEDDDDAEEEEEEELEVVDFNDVGKLFEQTKKRKKSSSTKKLNVEEVVEKQQFIGALSIPPSTPSPQTKKIDENDLSAAEKSQKDDDDDASQLYIDTQPTPILAEMAVPSTVFPSDDDVIVYVAPHPRKGMQTSPERQQPSTKGVPDTSEFTPYVRDALFSLAVASSSSSLTATKATIEQEPTQSSQPEPEPEPEPQSQPQISPSPPLSFPTPKGKKTPGGRLGVLRSLTISPLAIRSRKRKKGVLRKKGGKRTANTGRRSFRAFGAMREEALLDHDPKWKERRRGDSDLDWGDTDGDDDDDDDDDDDGSGGDHIADNTESPSGLGNGNVIGKDDKGKGKAREEADDDDDDGGHGMEVDSDLDLHAMQEFVGGLLGKDAGRHVTMDDLRDEEDGEERQDTGEEEEDSHRGIGSDESVISEGEDEEVEKVFADEEAMLISETLEFEDGDEEKEDDDDDDDGSEDEEDEDQTPRTSFQRRLERLRKQASSSKRDIEHDISDDDDEDDEDDIQMHFAEMNNFGYNKSYIVDSDEEFENFNHKKSKRRAADLPDDLKVLWEKDRLKKAAFKKARYQARLEAAADPLSIKKGGKKGRKAMLAAASVDPTLIVLPNRIIDMVTLVQQIRRFINDDDDGRQSMALPPTDKGTRKNIHELALAFNMKSISKGHGDARYTTLTKTSRSGLDVDEKKVAKIVRRKNYSRENNKDPFVKEKYRGDSFVRDKKGKKSRTGAQTLIPRHREGEEVGKAAPKLGSSNLGFRMLATMGWSEGERIGVTGGIQDPLTAIIKNTRLGLGAAK